MTISYQHKFTGVEFVPSQYDGKYRIMLEISSEQDFRQFAKIAHSARMTPIGTTQKNMISFAELDEK